MLILVKPLQLLNAHSPMLVTELGIVMLDKAVQSSNAEPSMLVTELGMVTPVSPLQP